MMSKSDKKEISFEKTMRNTELISYLESFIKSLKNGKIVIEQSGKFVCLTPTDMVAVEMEAKQKKGKEKLALEFSWKPEIRISSSEPVFQSDDYQQMS
jgi:amphi-Trp domain-containing protein